MRIPKGGVGFFDSGIGGLTVLSECQKLCKNQVFYYYGDHTHAPYGNKSRKQIRRYTLSVMKKFRRMKVKAVVLACNTVTAVCADELRRKFSFPIIGAEPAVYPAAKTGGLVYVLATKATVQSERFQNLCQRIALLCPQSEIKTFACEGLAGEIEKKMGKGGEYTRFLPSGSPDAVVLGCTHYIYIKEEIARFYGCQIFDGNLGIAKRLNYVLSKNQFLAQNDKKSRNLRPHLTTLKKINEKSNKRSLKMGKKQLQKGNNQKVFFLGKSRERMHFTHEQMFVLD